MNEAAKGVILGVMLSVAGQTTKDAITPPAKCKASEESVSTIQNLNDILKKTITALEKSCQK